MPDEPKPKRQYNSTRRRLQATQTRDHILSAARSLFIDRGYTSTTLADIAHVAGVSVESVYSIFGNKKAILAQVVHVAVVGDAEPTPITERAGARQVRIERDQRKQIRIFAHDMAEIMQRVSPLFYLIRFAADSDPDITALLQNLLAERLNGIAAFVRWLASNGPLRGNLSMEAATDLAWTLTSAEVYRLLTTDRAWSNEHYEEWIADNLAILLLPD